MSQIIFSDGPLIMASLKKEAHINWASPSHRGGGCVCGALNSKHSYGLCPADDRCAQLDSFLSGRWAGLNIEW